MGGPKWYYRKKTKRTWAAFEKDCWVTREGAEVPIKKMTVAHIANALGIAVRIINRETFEIESDSYVKVMEKYVKGPLDELDIEEYDRIFIQHYKRFFKEVFGSSEEEKEKAKN